MISPPTRAKEPDATWRPAAAFLVVAAGLPVPVAEAPVAAEPEPAPAVLEGLTVTPMVTLLVGVT